MESSYKYVFMCSLLVTIANTIPVRHKRSLLPSWISTLNLDTVNTKNQVIVLTCKEFDPCRNGGTCYMALYHEMRCMCPNGFTGRMCESEYENTTTTKATESASSSSSSTTTSATTTTANVNFTSQTLTRTKVPPTFQNSNVKDIMGSPDTTKTTKATESSSSSSSSSTTLAATTTANVNFTAQTLTRTKVPPTFQNTNVKDIMGSPDTNPGRVTTVNDKGSGKVQNLMRVTESNKIDNSIKQSTEDSGKASLMELNASKLQTTKTTQKTSINII